MPSNSTSADDDNTPDIIQMILNGPPFKIREESERLKILEKGRPLPKLNIIKRDTSRNCNRTFQSSWYDIHTWLCGSKNYNKLFCWPCLLMRPESSSWCTTGNDDMKRFSSLASKHAICKSHLKAISEYDSTLINFNLPPEFVNETNMNNKEAEGEEAAEETDSEEDLFNAFFNDEGKNKVSTESRAKKPRSTDETNNVNESENSKTKSRITFKKWQEMNNDNIPLNKSKCMEDLKLYRWKKRLTKQELKNAKLTGEKLKFEVKVLKAKAEYYKLLVEEVGKDCSPCPAVTDVAPEEKEEVNS